ncbi:MAG: hypothetical protein HUU49_03140 [Candidatus Buchananbacteria bacterium]|nr:hypothetical protein [Candidatus Buchananbacteria bacterium]
MKYTFLIPVHAARVSRDGYRRGDVMYDHPTPIDQDGPLNRTLESLQCLDHEDFNVVLLLSAVAPEIAEDSEAWIKEVVSRARYRPKQLYLFSHSHLAKLAALIGPDVKQFSSLLDLGGYPQERNIGLLTGILLNTDVVIWLDDDELVRDKDFLQKLDEGFAQTIESQPVRLITGACPEGEAGSPIRVRPMKPWMRYWDKIHYQNETFKIVFMSEPRWKKTPLSHGGLSAIHREVFSIVPYDPYALRGEDMDYNLNARMFGFLFVADNKLEIRHLPPPRIHPKWLGFRQDMLRFLWEINKIKHQEKVVGMRKITASEFEPYPGRFLRDDIYWLIVQSQLVMAGEYLLRGKIFDATMALYNIYLSRFHKPLSQNAFVEYCALQKVWVALTDRVAKIAGRRDELFYTFK